MSEHNKNNNNNNSQSISEQQRNRDVGYFVEVMKNINDDKDIGKVLDHLTEKIKYSEPQTIQYFKSQLQQITIAFQENGNANNSINTTAENGVATQPPTQQVTSMPVSPSTSTPPQPNLVSPVMEEPFINFEKLCDIVEFIWYRVPNSNELITKVDAFFKACIRNILCRLTLDEFAPDNLKILSLIFSPKYYRSEYRYHQENDDLQRKIAEHEINHFLNEHGVDILLNRVKNYKCSFETIKKIISVIKKLTKISDKISLNKFQQIVEVVYSKILKTSDEEFKNESKKDLDQIHKYLALIASQLEIDNELVAQNNLEVSLKCFKSPSLEKRNAGLNDIIRFIKVESGGSSMSGYSGMRGGAAGMVGPHFNSSYSAYSNYGSAISMLPTISPQKIVEWIKENKLVEQLYGETMHIQLLQKCTDILKFLLEQKAFEKRYLDLIWSAAEGKHETIENEIYHTITNIASYLSVEEMEYCFEKISKIPYEHYTHHTLLLIGSLIPTPAQIQQFQINTTTATNNNNQQQQQARYIPKGIEICWNLFQDECEGVTTDIMEQALVMLQESIQKFQDLKIYYLEKSLENLKKHTTVILSLRLIYHIIFHLQRKKSPSMNRHQENIDMGNIIEQVDNNYHIADLIYEQIIYYYQQVKQFVSQSMQTDEKPQFEEYNVSDLIIVGKHTHNNHISDYLGFLSFIYGHCPSLGPSLDQITTLWNNYIVAGLTSFDRNQFYQFIEKFRHLSADHILLLLNLFRSLSFKDIESSSLSFFILIINSLRSENFEQSYDGQQQPQQNNEIGLDDLWRIVLEAVNEEVGKTSTQCLIEVYFKQIHMAPEEFLNICISKLAHCPDNLSKSRCLSVIKKYLEDFGSKITDSFKRHYSPKINVNVIGMKGKFKLEVRQNETIANVKALIALKTNIQNPQTIYLYHNSKIMADDYESLEDNKVSHGDNITYQEHQDNPRYPEQFRGTDIHFEQEHYNTLFALLNSSDPVITQDAWDLLMLLPVDKKILEEIQTLSTSSQSLSSSAGISQLDWNQLLDSTSSYKLLYTIQIIDSIINPTLFTKDDHHEERMIWKQRFISAGGLQHLFDIIMKVDLQNESRGKKRKQCLVMILRVVHSFLENGILNVLQGIAESDLLVRLLNLISVQVAPTTLFDENYFILHETEDAIVTTNLFYFINLLLEANPALLDVLIKHKDISLWISLVTLQSRDGYVRDSACQGIKEICQKISPEKSTTFFLQQFFNLLFTTIDANRSISTCSQFFELLQYLLKQEVTPTPENPAGKIPKPQLEELLLKLINMVKTQPIVEIASVYIIDYAITGFLTLIKTIIETNTEFKYMAGVKEGLIKEIFHQCLFDIATADNHGTQSPPKCKIKDSRDICFQVLLELAKDCVENFKELTDLLMEHHKPEEKKTLWSYFPTGNEKSTCGYVGLKNLGATCYINSLMQQLFMIPGFRFNIFSSEEKYNNEFEQQESLLYQLRVIFSNLQESEKKSHDPKDFCSAYKYDGQPINTNVQMDVDEFFNMLFDKLETTLKGTPQEKLLLDFFGGSNVNQFISQECTHVSEREEPFYTLSVEVKNKKEIQESLQLFVESEVLDGDNKYFCSQCSQKVKALMRRCIKNLPNNLIIHNKRFEFDLDLLKRTKLNDQFRFPMTIDMSPYTKEFIERKERAEKAKAAGEPIPEEQPLHPPSYYQYDLAGIIVHTGTADSGHYYSYIKEREPLVEGQPRRWILFNDQATEIFNPEDISKACFGGYDQISNDQGKQGYRTARYNNAYMLFYERTYVQGDLTKKFEDIHPSSNASSVVPEELFSNVWNKNTKFLNDKNIFDTNYFGFISSILKLDKIPLPSGSTFDQNKQVLELGSRFLIETLFHSKERKLLPEISNHLIALFENHIEACHWLLKGFIDDPLWIKQNFLVCITSDPREYLSKILLSVIKTLLPQERPLYNELIETDDEEEDEDEEEEEDEDDDDESIEDVIVHPKPNNHANLDAEMIAIDDDHTTGSINLNNMRKQKAKTQIIDNSDIFNNNNAFKSRSIILQFMDTFLDYIRDAHAYWKHFSHYFNFIKEFALLGTEERAYMVERNVIGRLIDFYLGDESPVKHPPNKKTKMGDKTSCPVLDKMMEAIAILVTHCRTSADIAQGVNTDFLTMPEEDMKLLYNPLFLGKAIREGLSIKATTDILTHICRNDINTTDRFVTYILNYDPSRSGAECLLTLIHINDQCKIARMDLIMREYIGYLETIMLKQRNTALFKSLIEHACENPIASQWFLANIRDWLFPWLIEFEYMEVRNDAFTLVYNLMKLDPYIQYVGLSSSNHPNAAAQAQALAAQFDIQKTKDELLDLFNYLMSFLKSAKKIFKKEKYPKLENYFKLLRLLLNVPEVKTVFAVEYAEQFYKTTLDIMTQSNEIDRNRQELMHFIADCLRDSKENQEILFQEASFSQKLMDYFISINTAKEELRQFNQKSLPYFYEVLYILSEYSSDYLDYVASNNNFEWANKYLVCECGDYPDVAKFLLKISELVAQKRQKYIPKLLHAFLSFSNLLYYPQNSFQLLNILTPNRNCAHYFIVNDGFVVLNKYLTKESNLSNQEQVCFAIDLIYKIISLNRQKDPNAANLNGGAVVGETHSQEIPEANTSDIFKLSSIKLLLANLFNILDLSEKISEKSHKLLNLLSCEAPDLVIAALIEHQKKPHSSKSSPLINNNNNLSLANLNNTNMLQTLQQTHAQLQQSPTTNLPSENYYRELMEVIFNCSQSNQLTETPKLSMALCKVIKDMSVLNLELASKNLKKSVAYLKPEEKNSLTKLALFEQQNILNDPEIFSIIKSFLKEKDETTLMTICNTIEEKISMAIASIQSLRPDSQSLSDMDKHFQSLSHSVKQIELLENIQECSDKTLKTLIETLNQFAFNDCCNIVTEKAKLFLSQFQNLKISKQ